jgi:glutathione S-transferase
VQQWKRDRNFRAPDEARKVHPLGRFPMVEVDGHVLAESGAILEYFAEREQKLLPTGEEEKLRCRFFMHYAEGSAMPPLLVQLIVDKARTAKNPFFVKPIVNGVVSKIEQGYSGPAIDLHFGFLDNELASRPYFAGSEFSVADIQMYYPVEAGLSRGGGNRPNLLAWRERVTQRDAFKRAEAKGGTAIPKQA